MCGGETFTPSCHGADSLKKLSSETMRWKFVVLSVEEIWKQQPGLVGAQRNGPGFPWSAVAPVLVHHQVSSMALRLQPAKVWVHVAGPLGGWSRLHSTLFAWGSFFLHWFLGLANSPVIQGLGASQPALGMSGQAASWGEILGPGGLPPLPITAPTGSWRVAWGIWC